MFECQGHFSGATFTEQIPFFKADFTVLESHGEGASQPGENVNFYVQKGKYDYYLKEIKAYVAALLDEPVAGITGPQCGELCNEPEAAKGTRVWCEVSPKPGKFRKTGEPVLSYRWRAFTGAAK